MHPWHDLSPGDALQESFLAVIETPRDSRVQYALDPALGILRVRRVLFSAMHFPANYGFVPQTLGGDGEPVDVLVIGQETIAPMATARARAVGLLTFDEAGRRDDKVIAVHVDDPVFAAYRRCTDVPPYLRNQIERFFDDYRALEGVESVAGGFRTPEDGVALLQAAHARYAAKCDGRCPAAIESTARKP
jgi:inorganic pyrophosphatase